MRLIKTIHIKLYYYIANLVLNKQNLFLPEEFEINRNLFIYFDYEREFSGRPTNLNDNDIFEILECLDEHEVKTTWFTVGKLLDLYPESIHEILKRSHELGSHTYGHKIPFDVDKTTLKNDFEHFHKSKQAFSEVIGFHSPTGKWSLSLIKVLHNYNYLYDIISASKQKIFSPYMVINGSYNLIRLCTVGDDWSLYQKSPSTDEAFNYFLSLYKRIKVGDVAGIGFHPWVLYSDKNILAGFKRFITFIVKENETNIKQAGWYINKLKLNA
jgi:peptidoglycan-N-acetylglucosamine deacetylase